MFSHVQLPLTVVDKLATMMIFLKVFDFDVLWAIPFVLAAGAVIMVMLGHYFIKYKVMEREYSLGQSYNKEFMEILEYVREQKRKQTHDKYNG